MKFNLLFLIVAVVFMSNQLTGQSTSFSTDFSNPSGDNGIWAFIDEGMNEFSKEISNGELKITYDKTSWHFIQLWISPFDIQPFPYLKFSTKADQAFDLYVRIKDQDGVQLEKTISIGTEYQTFYFNITQEADTFASALAEIQFDVGFGDFSGILYFDDFMLGEAAKPAVKPPTIDQVDNLLVFKGSGQQTIKLSGISDGGEGNQNITITTETNDTTLLKDLIVQYNSPEDTGVLQFVPASDKLGSATIKVVVKDDGAVENTTNMEFDVVIEEFGGTGFSDDFETSVMDTLWNQLNPDYTLTRSEGILHIGVHKNAGNETFSCKLQGIFDFSAHPRVNVDLKGDQSFIFMVQLVDMNGSASSREIRIMKSSNFIHAMFDYSTEKRVDLSQITEVRFAVNPLALTFNGNIWLDNLKAGSDAVQLACLSCPEDIICYKNTENTKILLTDISGTSEIVALGKTGLISNALVSYVANDTATLFFDLPPDSTGTDTIILTAIGQENFEDNSVSFTITVTGNTPPLIDNPQDLIVAAAQDMTIKLTGLSDGDAAADQILTVTAVSDDENIVSNPVTVMHKHGSPYGYMTLTPTDTGTVNIKITVRDDGGENDSASADFTARVFNNINNPPEIDPVDKVAVFNDAGEQTVSLTGISDGDDWNQNLVIKAVSSVDSIVPNPLIIKYSDGDSALLKFTPDSTNTGITTVTLTVTDDGGTEENNGNDSVLIIFDIETRIPPKTGYVVPFEGNAADLLQGEGQFFNLSYVDSAEFRAVKIDMTDKWDFGGLWMDLPYELDMTDFPYISYEVYSVDNVTYHWNYFYDVNMERNIQNSSSHMFSADANKWVTISYDYSDQGDLNTETGELIQTGRIADILFNLHNRPGSWPFTDYSGTVYYRNICIGDKAVIPPKTPVVTIDGVPEQVHFVNEGDITLTLTGITNGSGSTSGVEVTAKSELPGVLPDPSVGTLNPDGTIDIIYTVGSEEGIAPISITVTHSGATSKTFKFDVNILKKDIAAVATLTVDRSITYQKILGFGAYQNETRWIDLYATDLGASAVRAGLIDNQVEPVNDNNDPYVLNRQALDYNAFDWEYFRKLKEAGVETFILTSWSPPAWMKKNLSLDWYIPQAIGTTMEKSNHLEYQYYDEYAESMVAVVKMFEEEADIHLEAIGLQNEPAFCEPYPSAILDPHDFPKLIEVVGKRFEKEGITTRLFMPEQVFGQSLNSMNAYIDSLIANTEADKYCDIIAVHGYASDGIQSGFPDYSEWNKLYNRAQNVSGPKELWMSETYIEGGSYNNALDLAGAIHGSLWAGNVSLWTNWSFGDMQLSRNQPTSSFYTSKNYFKFIRPGAVRVRTTTDNEDVMVTAFEHPENGTFTIVVINKSLLAKSARFFGSNLAGVFKTYRTTQYENCIEVDSVTRDIFILPPRSVTTFISSEFPILKINAIPDQYIAKNDTEQTVNLSGIDNGSGGIADLALSVETDNSSLITDLQLSQIQTDGTATLNYTPGIDQTGFAMITVKVSDGSDETDIYFYVIVTDNTGMKIVEPAELRIYPNPAEDKLFVEIPEPLFTNLTITDITGRIVVSKRLSAVQVTSIETSGFEPGLYVIILDNGKEKRRGKFMVE